MKFINLPKLDTSRSNFRNLKAIMGIGLFMLFFSSSVIGQVRVNSDGSAIATFGGKVETNTKITEIAYKKKTVGSFYVDSVWRKSDLYLVRDSMIMKNLQTRIDLRNNVLEILHKGEIKALPSYRIRSVYYTELNSMFVTENVLKSSEKGFYKIVVDDENSLLCKYNAKVKHASYNVTLDTGKRDDQIVKELSYFLYRKSGLIKLANSKSKLKKQFKSPEMVSYLVSHKTNPKKEHNLVQFVDFINKQGIQF